MKWIGPLLVTLVVLGVGGGFLLYNLMGECIGFPDWDTCQADKDRDSLAILLVTLALWAASLWTVSRLMRR